MDDHGGRFLLADEQDAFKERAGNLFSALDDVQYSPAQEGDSFLKNDPVKDGNQKFRGGAHTGCGGQNKNVTGSGYQHDRGGGSSTMPPPKTPPMKRRFRRPGHMQNPSKYTKYSLADVPDSQLSQKSNTAAALAFLTEIDAGQNKDKDEDKESQGNRPLFKKPVRKTTSKVAGEGRSPTIPSESGSADASQNKAKSKSKSGVAIKLSHLEYEDEE